MTLGSSKIDEAHTQQNVKKIAVAIGFLWSGWMKTIASYGRTVGQKN
jgi:hypothetical protein